MFALAGRMISLISSLMPSAIGCSRPSGPTRFGPDADLDPADHLALPQRQVGDAQHQRHHDRDDEGEAGGGLVERRAPERAEPGLATWRRTSPSGGPLRRRPSRAVTRAEHRRRAPRSSGCAAAMRTQSSGSRRRAPPSASPRRSPAHRTWPAATPSFAISARVHPGAAAAARPASSAAAASGAPAGRRSRSARRRCAGCRCGLAAALARRRVISFDKQRGDVACRPGTPRAPARRCRTRSPAGRAGCRARAAPSSRAAPRPAGSRVAWKLCTRPSVLTKVPAVSVNGAIGSSTSA